MRLLSVAAIALLATLGTGGCLDRIIGGGIEPEDYVSSKDYTTWVIEVDSVQGMAPSQGALDLLKSRLSEVADKPGGIEVRHSDTLPARGGTWSSREILDLADSTRDVKTSGKTVVTHLFFLDGSFEQEGVIGVAIGHGTIAIFSQTIRDACGLLCLTTPDAVFRSVLVHEFGHAMGLVDNGIPMVNDHEADECQGRSDQGHSSNPNSVMNCEVETSNIVNVFRGGPPTTFDAADKADLCNAGGKC